MGQINDPSGLNVPGFFFSSADSALSDGLASDALLVLAFAFLSVLSPVDEVVCLLAFVGGADVFLPSVVVVGSGIR